MLKERKKKKIRNTFRFAKRLQFCCAGSGSSFFQNAKNAQKFHVNTVPRIRVNLNHLYAARKINRALNLEKCSHLYSTFYCKIPFFAAFFFLSFFFIALCLNAENYILISPFSAREGERILQSCILARILPTSHIHAKKKKKRKIRNKKMPKKYRRAYIEYLCWRTYGFLMVSRRIIFLLLHN